MNIDKVLITIIIILNWSLMRVSEEHFGRFLIGYYNILQFYTQFLYLPMNFNKLRLKMMVKLYSWWKLLLTHLLTCIPERGCTWTPSPPNLSIFIFPQYTHTVFQPDLYIWIFVKDVIHYNNHFEPSFVKIN